MTEDEIVKQMQEIGPTLVATLAMSLANRLECDPANLGISLFVVTPTDDGDGERVQTFTTLSPELFAGMLFAAAKRALGSLKDEPDHSH